MATVSSIRPLPADVLSQIRSSVIIASLNDVVQNLVKNSLDGKASNITITVDYSRGNCCVEDNGLGIEPVDFWENGGLGKLHHTSKSFQCADNHGGRGSFIALLSALSLITITSHHYQHHSHNTLIMHQSKVIARQIPAPAEHRISDGHHGTRVTVRDLFGNMPVRVRQRANEPATNDKEWQNLRKCMVALLLAWPHGVSITVRNTISNQNIKIRSTLDERKRPHVDVNYLCSILSQAMFITPSDKEFWISTTASTSNLVISGTMSTEPCPHKNVQFLSFHVHPIADSNGCNFLYDHINRLFAMSSFGNEDEDELPHNGKMGKRSTDARYKQDGYTGKQLKGSKKGPNKWPMFNLKIESQNDVASVGEDVVNDFLDEKRGHLASIMDLLKVMVIGFLKEHHFHIRPGNRSERPIGIKNSPSPIVLQSVDQSRAVPISKITSRYRNHARINLGTNIKLPSFSRGSSSGLESPFNTWTRVKRSQTGNIHVVPPTDQALVKDNSFASEGPLSPKPIQSSREAPRTENLVSRREGREIELSVQADIMAKMVDASTTKDLPLIQPDGKISQLPFRLESHISSEKGLLKYDNVVMETPTPSDFTGTSNDNPISWIDPISKDKSLICRRTGLVAIPQSCETVSVSNSSLATSKSRALATRTKSIAKMKGKAKEEPSTWVSGLLNCWNNPVFQSAELSIPQMLIDGSNIGSQQILHGRHHTCTYSDVNNAFRQSPGDSISQITKAALRNAEVISQVDKKFILIKIEKNDNSGAERSSPSLLVLVDQHAADERCRIEELFYELYTNTVPQILEIPIFFNVSDLELQLFQKNMDAFRDWGILYEIADVSNAPFTDRRITVKGLPSVIIERCKVDPKVLANLMRTEVWNIHHRRDSKQQVEVASQKFIVDEPTHKWFTKLRDCPAGLLDILNSRSCRSAIMFNDELSVEQCISLISRLARCAFPFQCAHGRPSMIPLVDLSTIFQKT